MSIPIASLGFPRIGPRRELKKYLEDYWAGKIGEERLQADASALRIANWAMQKGLGVTDLPSNDFSLYDHVLDATAMLGAVPPSYGWAGGNVTLDVYFAMARGSASTQAMEMTKWFDTNYHYIVPSFVKDQRFSFASNKIVDDYIEGRDLGYQTRPVLLGPISYLLLGKGTDGTDPLALLPNLLPIYIEVLRRLANVGARWVQMDEPCLVLDLGAQAREAMSAAYDAIAQGTDGLNLLVATYFGALGDNLDLALRLPVAGLHVDLVRAPEQLAEIASRAPRRMALSLGIVDGRNVWRTDIRAVLDRIEPIVARRSGQGIMLAPSCSLLHVPIDLELETDCDPALKTWLAFAVQKLNELRTIDRALTEGREAIAEELRVSDMVVASRSSSSTIHNSLVAKRLASETADMSRRNSPFERRREEQRQALNLPLLPTTTIGSFPQTDDLRKARAASGRGALAPSEYEDFLRKTTRDAVLWQQEIGLDVIVHGEFERNDMVQYFGERLYGFAFTKHGWVQSYGSRCVRPPIIYGDVRRPGPMTVAWSRFAQSLTQRPVKGMLTGPVTILQWSFVRDDIGRGTVCRQIAFALRDEVIDLEAAGIRIIQIDEPALREGLPLRRAAWAGYLAWAVECFRIASSGVRDATQIQTHMCYAEFNDIVEAIAALDADVILIEATRSKMELLDAFAGRYSNEIGPGVYDIHSPRCPTADEILALIEEAARRIEPDRLWVTPDCGLKTRSWDEVRPALVNMVRAAALMRESLASQQPLQ
jgi:5-methyltetrahydropteroyltriglutamate--homocysteine methyltransferase